MAKDKNTSGIIKNRRASYDYQLEQKFDAGIVLTGAEVKSIRDGKASISEAYCLLDENGIIIKGMHIAEFVHGGYVDQNPLRERRLLLQKKEIKKLQAKMRDTGYTIIPLLVFFSESGFAKIRIALARGKKTVDKRQDLKTKDVEKELRKHVR